MRRKEREVTDRDDIRAILAKARVLRIALNNGPYPYLIPVNYGFALDGARLTLVFHSANEGAKHAIIAKDNRATFEIDCAHALLRPHGDAPCTASFAYESLIGNGTIEQATDTEKEPLLALFLEHYGLPATPLNPTHLANTTVYKLNVTAYTAKRNLANHP